MSSALLLFVLQFTGRLHDELNSGPEEGSNHHPGKYGFEQQRDMKRRRRLLAVNSGDRRTRRSMVFVDVARRIVLRIHQSRFETKNPIEPKLQRQSAGPAESEMTVILGINPRIMSPRRKAQRRPVPVADLFVIIESRPRHSRKASLKPNRHLQVNGEPQ